MWGWKWAGVVCLCSHSCVHQRGRCCRLSVTVLNIPPTSILFFFTALSLWDLHLVFFLPAHLSNTCLALMFEAHQKKSATRCFKSLITSHKPTILPLLSFFSSISMQLLTSLSSSRTCLSFSGLLCQRVGRRVREHVCNPNSMLHTVQMAVLLSLWLSQLKVNRGKAYARPSVCVTQHRITGTQWESPPPPLHFFQ